MKHYGLTIAEGSEITNPTVATGTSFPGNESTGELFFRTDTDTLYVWDGTQWDSAGGGASAAGSDREIQFNDSGSFGASAVLKFYDNGNDADVRVQDQLPGYTLRSDAAGTDEGIWRIQANGSGGYLDFQGVSDDEASASTYMRVYRSSGSQGIDRIELFDDLRAQNGTAGSPPYAFSAASNTGMYRDSSTGELRLSVLSTDMLQMTSSVVTIGGILDVNGNSIEDSTEIPFKIGGTELMKLTASGGGDGTLWVKEGYYSTNDAGNSFLILDGSSGNVSFIDLRVDGTLEANIYANTTAMEIQSAVEHDLYLCRGGGNVRIYHDLLLMDSDESNSITIKAPATVTTDRTWTAPQDDPTTAAGKFITTDASGIWSFADAGGTPGGSDRQVQFNDSGSLGGSSALVLESDGTLNVAGTTDYEDQVTDDDDIPNKKYVDDAIANSPEYSTQNILYQYTATSGQTTFTGTDNNGKTLTYSDASELMVFKTGTLLDPTDYTATNGTDVVLDTGAEAGAEINIMRFVSVERYDTLQTFRYLMDTGETTASGTDAKGNTLTYAVGLINVFLNGGKLSEDQYTATDGTSIVLDDALPDDNNILEVQTFSTFTSIDEVVARANMIINPNMDVWQRNTSVTSVANSAFVADRWQFTASGAGVFDMSRSTDAPVGSEYSLDLTVTTADASIGSTDYYGFLQTIEGNNIRDLKMGTSSAQSITLSFYVKSSVTGTYTVCFRNKNAGASYRSYVAEYTISTADTWERVVITLDGDTSGTWNSDESGGLEIFFWLAAGSAFHTTAGSWATGNLISSANQVNAVGTVSNSFKVTQVRCEVGSVAAGFRSRSIGEELALCQRYFNRVNSANGVSKMAGQAFNTTYGAVLYDPPVHMRGVPTVSASLSSSCLLSSSGGCSNFSSLGTISADNDSILVRINTTGSPNTLVAGNATSLYFGSTSDYLDFDAEL